MVDTSFDTSFSTLDHNGQHFVMVPSLKQLRRDPVQCQVRLPRVRHALFVLAGVPSGAAFQAFHGALPESLLETGGFFSLSDR